MKAKYTLLTGGEHSEFYKINPPQQKLIVTWCGDRLHIPTEDGGHSHISTKKKTEDVNGKNIYMCLYMGCAIFLKDGRQVVIVDVDCKRKLQNNELIDVVYCPEIDEVPDFSIRTIKIEDILFNNRSFFDVPSPQDGDVILHPTFVDYDLKQMSIDTQEIIKGIIKERKQLAPDSKSKTFLKWVAMPFIVLVIASLVSLLIGVLANIPAALSFGEPIEELIYALFLFVSSFYGSYLLVLLAAKFSPNSKEIVAIIVATIMALGGSVSAIVDFGVSKNALAGVGDLLHIAAAIIGAMRVNRGNLDDAKWVKILQVIGTLVISVIASGLVYLLFNALTPWLFKFNVVEFCIFVFLGGSSLIGFASPLVGVISIPYAFLTPNNVVAKIVNVLPISLFGFLAIVSVWSQGIHYGLLQVLIGISLTIMILILCASLAVVPINIDNA